MNRRCDRCHEAITPEDARLAWPVAVMDGEECEYICPSCYGDGAVCPEGHVLPGDEDSSDCQICDDADEAEVRS